MLRHTAPKARMDEARMMLSKFGHSIHPFARQAIFNLAHGINANASKVVDRVRSLWFVFPFSMALQRSRFGRAFGNWLNEPWIRNLWWHAFSNVQLRVSHSNGRKPLKQVFQTLSTQMVREFSTQPRGDDQRGGWRE